MATYQVQPFRTEQKNIQNNNRSLFLLGSKKTNKLKPSQNKKGQKIFQLHHFLNPFPPLPAVKSIQKKVQLENFWALLILTRLQTYCAYSIKNRSQRAFVFFCNESCSICYFLRTKYFKSLCFIYNIFQNLSFYLIFKCLNYQNSFLAYEINFLSKQNLCIVL